MPSRSASPTPTAVSSPRSPTTRKNRSGSASGMSAKAEPDGCGGTESGTQCNDVDEKGESGESNNDDNDNDAGDAGDTLSPLGQVLSRSSVLHRMASRASRASRTSRRERGEATQLEMLLRSQTRESGRVAHADGEKGVLPEGGELAHACTRTTTVGAGVLEKRMVVDLGNGPEEVCVVEWVTGDPEHPFNWPTPRKWLMVFCVCYLTALTAVNATSSGVIAEWGMPWFGTDHTGFTMGLFVYLFAVAWTPLVLAPMSEMFGRSGIYHVTGIINALLFIPQALSHNYSGFLAARWFQGMSSSVGNSMVGGTVADLFDANSRGPAMNFFAFFIFLGQSLGGAVFGWVGQELGIQWCYGIMGIAAGLSVLLNFAVLKETRADVLLQNKARRLTRETGIKHIAPSEVNARGWSDMLSMTTLRPILYLFTEPIVTAISAWIGFAWGCIFLGTSSTLLVFRQYGWSSGMTGMSELALLVGAVFGYMSNIHNEWMYRRKAAKSPSGRAPPEARLYWAATGGLLFPLCMFAYAWTGRPSIPWIAPAIFLSMSNWGVYVMYSSVFNYLADAYEIYSSSAQASHSFVRNIASAVFPLFATSMYEHMGYPQASTLVGAIATALAAAPVVIIVYGPRLRAKSKVASAIWGAEGAGHGVI